MLPLTVKALKLPKLVIPFNVFGARLPLNTPPLIVPATVKLSIDPLAALITPAVTVPAAVRLLVLIELASVKLVSVPTVVIFGWFAVVILALSVAASIAPVTLNDLRPLMLVRFAVAALNTPAVTVPLAVRLLV